MPFIVPPRPVLHREEYVAIALFIFVCGGYFFSQRWSANIPRMFRRAQFLLQREISALGEELPALNNPSTFAQYSKLQRRIAALEKNLEAQRAKDGGRRGGTVAALSPHFVTFLTRFGFILPAVMLWGALEVVVVPRHLMSVGFVAQVLRGKSVLELAWNVAMALASLLLACFEFMNLGTMSESDMVGVGSGQASNNTLAGSASWIPRTLGVVGWVLCLMVAVQYVHRSLR